MKKNKMMASVLLCLMLTFAVFAGDADTGGRACDPQTQQCPQQSSNSSSVTTSILAVLSQIASLIK